MATNSYTKYCVLFDKKAFLALVRGLTSLIDYLAEKKLKAKVIKEYLAGLELLCLECTLDEIELKFYSHSMLQKIIKDFWKIYKERNT